MIYDFFHNPDSDTQIELYKNIFFDQFKNFLSNNDIKIKKIIEDDSEFPERLACFYTCHPELNKPTIILHCNRINDYIKKIDAPRKIEYLIELIIYHELSHWLIESIYDSYNEDEGEQQISFHEALAQYFTNYIFSIDPDDNKKIFFDWFCNDKFSNDVKKKKTYMLWKVDETDGFELVKHEINSVIDAIKECKKKNTQSWVFLKEILSYNLN
jgi:hypothetical protein